MTEALSKKDLKEVNDKANELTSQMVKTVANAQRRGNLPPTEAIRCMDEMVLGVVTSILVAYRDDLSRAIEDHNKMMEQAEELLKGHDYAEDN